MTMAAARHSASFFIFRLNEEARRIRINGFPGHHDGPHMWLELIQGMLDTAKAYVKKSEKSNRDDYLETAEDLSLQAYDMLSAFNGKEVTSVPHQVVAPLQDWADGMGIKQPLFFCGSHNAIYELDPVDYKRYHQKFPFASDSLKAAVTQVRHWPILCVTVPSESMGILPHFAVVAHELGHAVLDHITVDPDIAEYKKFIKRVKQRLKASGTLFNEAIVNEKFVHIHKAWTDELKADAVGHYIAGPAFFFAFCGFLEMSGRSFGLQATHPPSVLRRRQLFNQMVAGNQSFASVLLAHACLDLKEDFNSPHIPSYDATEDTVRTLTKQLGDSVAAAVLMELPQVIEAIAPSVYATAHRFLKRQCPGLIYTPEKLDHDLSQHLDALCSMVPPIEYRSGKGKVPCDLATILNVGWTVLLAKLDSFGEVGVQGSDKPDPALKISKLHELLLKAAELSQTKKVWENMKMGRPA